MPKDNGAVKIDDKYLTSLIKAFKGAIPYAHVGILGSSARTQQDKSAGKAQTLTNAEIGEMHEQEFGSSKMPRRSFLRVPLTEHLNEFLQNSPLFDKLTIKDVIKNGSIRNWIESIGITGEQVVRRAFDTSGFGNWPASNFNKKKVHQTLVETGQLRDSIISEVID